MAESQTVKGKIQQFAKSNSSLAATQGQILEIWREIGAYETSDSITFSTGLTNTAGTVTVDLSTGKAGGQLVYGGTVTSENLTLTSTAHATKGLIYFGSAQTSYFTESTGDLLLAGGITTAQPSANGPGKWKLGKIKTGLIITGVLPDQAVEITIDDGSVIPLAIAQI